ncbi:hypothetical protein N658DRAFT_49247 [Parathielavia hyrcaniae]|uniref:Uncharacterized protein n=1 Tax=Parathielavia hyrcaniae TaxID=113614 RepID=A0AAN6Q102_9PEZI|nr:hypothetical protein N658DRAFT_49247 [Parathielavia hyrcaniae]
MSREAHQARMDGWMASRWACGGLRSDVHRMRCVVYTVLQGTYTARWEELGKRGRNKIKRGGVKRIRFLSMLSCLTLYCIFHLDELGEYVIVLISRWL